MSVKHMLARPVDLFRESLLLEYDQEALIARLNERVKRLPDSEVQGYVEETEAIAKAADAARELISRRNVNSDGARNMFRNAVQSAGKK